MTLLAATGVLFLEFLFFAKSCLKVGGAAYTRMRLILKSLRYLIMIMCVCVSDLIICNYCSLLGRLARRPPAGN